MQLSTTALVPDARHISGWVNGNLYQKSTEVFGILPIPENIRANSGMQPFVESIDSESPQRYTFLARKHTTRKAVLPLHLPAEYKLFSKLMRENPFFNTRDGHEPDWVQAVKIWNRYAENQTDVLYKVSSTSSCAN